MEDWESVEVAGVIRWKVPNGAKITEERPAQDFVIATVRLGNVVLLSAYIGNHPSFPGRDAEEVKTRGSIGRYRAREAKGKEGSNCYKEVLVELEGNQRWPGFVQYRINRVSVDKMEDAERIIASTVYIDPSQSGSRKL
jgi:hypothetical protein